jgi:hypothetical protein
MQAKNKTQIEWYYGVPLLNAVLTPIPIGHRNSLRLIANIRDCHNLIFGFITEKAANVILDGSLTPDFTVVTNIFTLAAVPTVWTDVYTMPPPRNFTGLYEIGFPYIRFSLQDTAAANHSYTRFYAKVFW